MGFLNLLGKIVESSLKALAFALVICAIIGFPIMWLWNWLMPNIFGLTEITFWQAVGLGVLSTLLLKIHVNPTVKKDDEK